MIKSKLERLKILGVMKKRNQNLQALEQDKLSSLNNPKQYSEAATGGALYKKVF